MAYIDPYHKDGLKNKKRILKIINNFINFCNIN